MDDKSEFEKFMDYLLRKHKIMYYSATIIFAFVAFALIIGVLLVGAKFTIFMVDAVFIGWLKGY